MLLLAILAAAAIFGIPLLKGDPAPTTSTVPSLVGMDQSEARAALQQVSLRVGEVTMRTSQDVAEGDVLSSDPEAGEKVEQGGTVDLRISSGKPSVKLPDVTGMDKQDARDQLVQLGLDVEFDTVKSDDPRDQVTAMNPQAGQSVGDGSSVSLSVSQGPRSVPNVVGKTQAEARRTIEGAGFKVSVVNDSTTKSTKGQVLEQSPDAGTAMPQGSTVTIVVSTYEPPSPSPSPSETPSQTPSATQTQSPTATPGG